MDLPDYGALREPGASSVALPNSDIFGPGHHIIGEDYQRWLVGYNEPGPEDSNASWTWDFPFLPGIFDDQVELHHSKVLGNRSANEDLPSGSVQEQQTVKPLQSIDGLPNLDLAPTPWISDPANEQTQSSTIDRPLSAKKTRRYGPEKWETIRHLLREIYILQGNTLLQTMEILEKKHGFMASYV